MKNAPHLNIKLEMRFVSSDLSYIREGGLRKLQWLRGSSNSSVGVPAPLPALDPGLVWEGVNGVVATGDCIPLGIADGLERPSSSRTNKDICSIIFPWVFVPLLAVIALPAS